MIDFEPSHEMTKGIPFWKKGLSIPRGLEPQSIGFCIPMLNHFATQKSMVGWAIISSWLLLSQCNCLSKWKKRDGKV